MRRNQRILVPRVFPSPSAHGLQNRIEASSLFGYAVFDLWRNFGIDFSSYDSISFQFSQLTGKRFLRDGAHVFQDLPKSLGTVSGKKVDDQRLVFSPYDVQSHSISQVTKIFFSLSIITSA